MLGFASTLHSKVAGIVGANLPLPHSMWIWGLFLSVRTFALLRFFEGLVSCKTQEQSASFPSCHAAVVVGAPVSETSKSCCVPTYLGEGCHGLGFFSPNFVESPYRGRKPWGKRGVICWRPVFYSKQQGSENDFSKSTPQKEGHQKR